MKLRSMTKVIGGKRYDTDKAIVIADNCYWDGHNYERQGRNTFLCRTPKGSYYVVRQTCWQGEVDSLTPLTLDEAIEMYESLHEQNVPFEEAFPGIKVEEA